MRSAGKTFVAIAVVLLSVASARSDEPTAITDSEKLIEASIAYHDPNGVWDSARVRFAVSTVYSEEFQASHNRPPSVEVTLMLAPGHGEFHYTKKTGDDLIEMSFFSGKETVAVNGSVDVSDAEKERLSLREPAMYRDYFEYLYLMPMKLRDAGTIIAPAAEPAEFNGRRVLSVKVTYAPDVGEHTWYFYFDPGSHALVGYSFYKDEPNDGEYITFEGEIVDEASGLRLPKARAWYYSADDGHLATDDITSLTTLPAEE